MKVSKDNMWADNRRILPRRTTGVNKRLLKAIEESGMSNGQIAVAAETTASIVSAYIHNKMPVLGRDGWAPAFQRICTVLAVCPNEIAGMKIDNKKVAMKEPSNNESNHDAFVKMLLTIASIKKKGDYPVFKEVTLRYVRMYFFEGYSMSEIAAKDNVRFSYVSNKIRSIVIEIRKWFEMYGVTIQDFYDGTAEIKMCNAIKNDKYLLKTKKMITEKKYKEKKGKEEIRRKNDKEYDKQCELRECRCCKNTYLFHCTKDNFRYSTDNRFYVVTNCGNVIDMEYVGTHNKKIHKKCIVCASIDDGILRGYYIQKAS